MAAPLVLKRFKGRETGAVEISTGDSAVRGLHRGPGPSVCPLRGSPPSAPSSGTCRQVTGAAPAAPRALAGAIAAHKALRTDTGEAAGGSQGPGALPGQRAARALGVPLIRLPRPLVLDPPGSPRVAGGFSGARSTLAAGFVPRSRRSRAAARSPGTSRQRRGGCPQVGAGSPAAPGPSPADGAAAAPSPGLRSPDGPHLAWLSPPAVSGTGALHPAWRGRRGSRGGPRQPRARVRARYVSRRSQTDCGSSGLARGGKRLLTEMSDSDGHSLRLPGLLAAATDPRPDLEPRLTTATASTSAESRDCFVLPGPSWRQRRSAGPGTGVVGAIKPCSPFHPRRERFRTRPC